MELYSVNQPSQGCKRMKESSNPTGVVARRLLDIGPLLEDKEQWEAVEGQWEDNGMASSLASQTWPHCCKATSQSEPSPPTHS